MKTHRTRGRWDLDWRRGASHHLEGFERNLGSGTTGLSAIKATPALKDKAKVLPPWEGGKPTLFQSHLQPKQSMRVCRGGATSLWGCLEVQV